MTKYAELAERLRDIEARCTPGDTESYLRMYAALSVNLPLILSALADADRLEWLEKDGGTVCFVCDEGCGVEQWQCAYGDRLEMVTADTAREAIDAARRTGR